MNDLLEPFGAAFGDAVLEGDLVLCDDDFGIMSGANVARLPAGAWLHTAAMTDKATVGENRRVNTFSSRPCCALRACHSELMPGRWSAHVQLTVDVPRLATLLSCAACTVFDGATNVRSVPACRGGEHGPVCSLVLSKLHAVRGGSRRWVRPAA